MELSRFEALPVLAPFVRLRAPRRDDAPFVIFSVDIDDRYFPSLHQPDRVDSLLTVVEAVIDSFEGRAFEDAHSVCKRYSVQDDVAAVLLFIPSVMHDVYLHNVNTATPDPTTRPLLPAPSLY